MKRKLVFCMLAALMLFAVGCGGGGTPSDPQEPDDGGDPPEEIQTTYEEKYMSPDYAEVDLTGYTTYYFDPENGDDANSGTSEDAPKQTLAQLNTMINRVDADQPTRFLLKGGATFTGSLDIQYAEATKEKPLIVGSYGEGMAIINGNGSNEAVLISVGNLRISGLEVTNPTGKIGIYVYLVRAGALSDLVISDCYVHEVNWNWTEDSTPEEIAAADAVGSLDVRSVCPNDNYVYERGGIIFNTHQDTGVGPSWYENIWVENNHVQHVSRSGMFFTSMWIKSPATSWGVNKFISYENGWYPSENVVIRDNFVEYTGGDNIVLLGSVDSYIEGNRGYHGNFLGRTGYANAGIWPINVRGCVIQYNEAAYCHLENGATDGEGFDLDIGCKDVLFQYNYSHDNDGGGLLACNNKAEMYVFDENGDYVFGDDGQPLRQVVDGEWTDVTVRNNVFVNNGKSSGNPAFLVISSSCKNMEVYNNIIVMRDDVANQTILVSANYGGTVELPSGFVFKNNILYKPTATPVRIGLENMQDYLFENNIYYNISEDVIAATGDTAAVTDVDPQITVPSDKDGYDKVTAYVPQNEAVFSGASKLESMLKYDLAGSDAEGVFYYGAFCKKP